MCQKIFKNFDSSAVALHVAFHILHTEVRPEIFGMLKIFSMTEDESKHVERVTRHVIGP